MGSTPLHSAAGFGCGAAAEALLACGAPDEAWNHFGNMPLVGVASFGSREVAERLLVHRDDIVLTNHWGETALTLVNLYSGDAGLATPLAALGCPMDACMTSLLAGARRVSDRTIRTGYMLRGWGVKITAITSRSPDIVAYNECDGKIALMTAAMLGKRDVARAILGAAADASLTSRNGFTAADWRHLFRQPDGFVQELRAAAAERANWISMIMANAMI